MVNDNMIDFVKKTIENEESTITQLDKIFPFRKRFEHSYRVYKIVLEFCKGLEVNKDVLITAALFHDIGKPFSPNKNHAKIGADICRQYLIENKYPVEFINDVCFLISNHSNSFEEIEKIDNIELHLLQDADWLDEIGLMSLLWDAMDEGTNSFQSYSNTLVRVEYSYNRLLQTEKFHTESGFNAYRFRMTALKTAINQIRYELGI